MRPLGCFVVIAVLAAGCATPAANQPTANDRTDVWFTQHMVPYLRQTTTVVSLTRPYLTDPPLPDWLTRSTGRARPTSNNSRDGWTSEGCRRTFTATNGSIPAGKPTWNDSPSCAGAP